MFISATIAKVYNTPFSRHFIKPYCWWHYGDANFYKKFNPGGGKDSYTCFQDFFTRTFVNPPEISTESVWPCEGLLCDSSKVGDFGEVNVKGDIRPVRSIFGKFAEKIEDNDHFTNVFLHNNNYHHIHAPVDAEVTDMERIPGELLLLRPWAYKRNPSLPAFTNERVNVELKDKQGRYWYLSIVGGPLVATIEMAKGLTIGSNVLVGEQVAAFKLGSTCCMISPVSPEKPTNSQVEMGEPLH